MLEFPMLKSLRYAQSKWPYNRSNMTEYIYEYPSGISSKVVGNFPGFFSAKLKLIRPIGKRIIISTFYTCTAVIQRGFSLPFNIKKSLF